MAAPDPLDRLHRSLYEWAFADIKRASDTLPRLAFVGLAAWIDTLAYLVAGRKDGITRWTAFLRSYLPDYLANNGAERLYVGLRCRLLHEYGTLDMLLTHLPREKVDYWLFPEGDTLSLPVLLTDLEGAYERFRRDLQDNDRLREAVLRRGVGLLTETEFEIGAAQAASASSGTSIVRVGHQRQAAHLPFDGLPPRGHDN